MGLLDLFDNGDAQLGLGLLAAAAPRADAAGFGQRLMEGVQAGQKMRDQQTMRQYQQAQMQEAQRQLEQERKIREMAGQFYRPGTPGLAPSAGDPSIGILPSEGRAAVPASYDYAGYANALAAAGMPEKAIAIQSSLAKETPFNKVDPQNFTPESVAKFSQTRNYGDLVPVRKLEASEGVVWNPFDPKMAGRTLPNPNKPFMLGSSGEIVANGPYQQYEISKAKAGAASTNVKVENKMGESAAAQIGPMAKDSKTQAQAAVKMFDSADRLEKALASNKVQAGPLATQIQTVKQLIQTVGGGNDESIRQTRQAIKSLAQMSVEARKQLAGQGQVTEAEAAAVAKADAGDINDLTIGELKDLVTLTKRAAHMTAKSHSELLTTMGNDPATSPTLPFYKVQGLEPILNYSPQLPQIGGGGDPVDDLVNKYRSKK